MLPILSFMTFDFGRFTIWMLWAPLKPLKTVKNRGSNKTLLSICQVFRYNDLTLRCLKRKKKKTSILTFKRNIIEASQSPALLNVFHQSLDLRWTSVLVLHSKSQSQPNDNHNIFYKILSPYFYMFDCIIVHAVLSKWNVDISPSSSGLNTSQFASHPNVYFTYNIQNRRWSEVVSISMVVILV